jgi:hypothetical protein
MYQQQLHGRAVDAQQQFSPVMVPPPAFSGQPSLPTPPYESTAGYPTEKAQNLQQFQSGMPNQYQQGIPQPPFQSGQVPLASPPYESLGGYPPEKVQQMLQSLPPEQLQQIQQQIQASSNAPSNFVPPTYVPPTPGQIQPSFAAPPTSHTPATAAAGGKIKDQQNTKTMKRIMGDSVVGRVIRSTVRTATTAMKMPEALSPWGDNNPVTLPNVRYRDAVLMVACHGVAIPMADGVAAEATSLFGADAFISEVINSAAGQIVTHMGAVMAVRMALDSLGNMSSTEDEKILTTTNVKSLRVQLKHKLMGVDADVRFSGVYPAYDTKSCAKGWFCPYLFASARTPAIPRMNEFAIAQCFGPFLAADYAMAHKIAAESTHVLALCDADPKTDIGTNRMVITFAALTPYRGGNGMWSTSRRPGCAMLHCHLFDGCPALIIPVNAQAPIVAWSPWTLAQMQEGKMMQSGGYVAEIQHEQICEWLDGLISVPHVLPEARERYVDVLARGVSLIINGALCLDSAPKSLLGKIDAERAGIAMFRY